MSDNIIIITDHKKRYLELLLLADEQESMIDRYLERGDMFVLEEEEASGKEAGKGRMDGNRVKAVCVITDEGNGVCELKNLAVSPGCQRQGYGRRMVNYIIDFYGGKYRRMVIGTGEVPWILEFYKSCGFKITHRIENFITDHYDHPIVDNGVLLADMVYLERAIPEYKKDFY